MRTSSGKIGISLVLGILAIGCTAFLYGRDRANDPARQADATIARGSTSSTIRVTGRLEPEEVIDVGAQMCGRIVAFGQDADGKPIESGSIVEEGMVLARISDRLAVAEVAQAEAALAQAHSTVERAKADLEQHKAKLPEAEARWTATQQLHKSGAANPMEMVTNKTGYDVARANVAVGEAAIVQAQNAVAQAEASLQQARQKQSLSVIRSPVTGVVLERRVNVGQTIITNMQAPSLFLVAKDLRHMRLRAELPEADIGRIQRGRTVRFTVDALPGQAFEGTVEKVCLNGRASPQGMAYRVEVRTANPDGKLLPYMTVRLEYRDSP